MAPSAPNNNNEKSTKTTTAATSLKAKKSSSCSDGAKYKTTTSSSSSSSSSRATGTTTTTTTSTSSSSSATSKRKMILKAAEQPQVVLLSSIQTNKLGGIRPTNGNAYTLDQKKQIALVYTQLLARLNNNNNKNNNNNNGANGGGGGGVSVNRLSKEAKVSRNVAKKIMMEIQEYGGVVDPNGIKLRARHSRGIGPGAEIFSSEDELVLLQLRQRQRQQQQNQQQQQQQQQPDQKLMLGTYQQALLEHTGKKVSMATICRWIQYQDESEQLNTTVKPTAMTTTTTTITTTGNAPVAALAGAGTVSTADGTAAAGRMAAYGGDAPRPPPRAG